MTELETIIDKYTHCKEKLIGLLQDLMEKYGYLDEEVLREVSKKLDVPLTRLYALATFYNNFRLDPCGKHKVCLCMGTACHVKGAAQILERVEDKLGVKAGETTPDGLYSLETVNCLGACALSPLMVIDDEYHGNLDSKKALKLLTETMECEEK